ncbi:MAG TPA: hypothetical protein VHD61_10165 [Lacunisphaera sp.]|nr:hypothetical protein [Lacunisphaera sp.]
MNSTPSDPQPWFRRLGWFYRPVHLFGWIVSLAALAFLANVFLVLDARAHSVSDVLYNFYAYAAPTFLGVMWIGSRTSGENTGTRA